MDLLDRAFGHPLDQDGRATLGQALPAIPTLLLDLVPGAAFVPPDTDAQMLQNPRQPLRRLVGFYLAVTADDGGR